MYNQFQFPVINQVNLTNLSEFPGVILSNDEKLKQGTKLVIDSSITKIGYGALVMNTSLKEVIITGGDSIKSYAFYNCSSLTSVFIPDSVTSIGSYIFSGCDSVTIYCEASSQPSGWDPLWNYSNRPVYWGVTLEDIIEQNGIQI